MSERVSDSIFELAKIAYEHFDEEVYVSNYWGGGTVTKYLKVRRYVVYPYPEAVGVYDTQNDRELVATVCSWEG